MMALYLNRHAKKRRHKHKLEEQYARKYYYGGSCPADVKRLRQKLMAEAEEDDGSIWYRKHPPRNRGWEYWKIYYLTGRRQYAKKYSDRRIRQKYRQIMHNADPEDITALQGSDYEKEYDYYYTIY